MTDLLERPRLPEQKVRRGLALVLAVIGITGAATLGLGLTVHDLDSPPLIVHGVQSR